MDLSRFPKAKSHGDPFASFKDILVRHTRRVVLSVPSRVPVGANYPFSGIGIAPVSLSRFICIQGSGAVMGFPFMPIVRDKFPVKFMFCQDPIKALMEKTGMVKEVLGFFMFTGRILQIISFVHGKSPLRFSRYLRSPLQVVSKSGDKLIIHPQLGYCNE